MNLSTPVPVQIYCDFNRMCADNGIGNESRSDKDTRLVLLHIVINEIVLGHKWTPISSTTIRRDARYYDQEKIRKLCGIERHSRREHRCREFRYNQEVHTELTQSYHSTGLNTVWVSPSTGKPADKPRSNLRGYPPRLGDVIRELCVVVFDLVGVQRHIEWLERRHEKTQRVIQARQAQPDRPRKGRLINEDRRNRSIEREKLAQRRLNTDKRCYVAILECKPRLRDDGFYEYTPVYRMCSTGRVYQVGGALQSCSGRMKRAAYGPLPNVFNWDLVACHPSILACIEKRNGLPYDVWDDYFEKRKEYADKIGIPEAVLKRIVNAMINNGKIPSSLYVKKNSILDILKKRVTKDHNRLTEILARMRVELAPIIENLQEFHRWVLNDLLPRAKGGYIRNDHLKMRFRFRGLNREKRLKKVVSFLLQSEEADFIGTLILLGPHYGYKAIAHEHDGFISIGVVPPEAVKEAIRLSKFDRAMLVEKSFV
jgi:hypothetical protein